MQIHHFAAVATLTLLVAEGASFADTPANQRMMPLFQRDYGAGQTVSNFGAKSSKESTKQFGQVRRPQNTDWWAGCRDAIQSGEQVPIDSQASDICVSRAQ
jgi:hypothetical protein